MENRRSSPPDQQEKPIRRVRDAPADRAFPLLTGLTWEGGNGSNRPSRQSIRSPRSWRLLPAWHKPAKLRSAHSHVLRGYPIKPPSPCASSQKCGRMNFYPLNNTARAQARRIKKSEPPGVHLDPPIVEEAGDATATAGTACHPNVTCVLAIVVMARSPFRYGVRAA